MAALKFKRNIAAFGAAFTSLYLAPTIEADIVDLSDLLPDNTTDGFQSFDLVHSPNDDIFVLNSTYSRQVVATGDILGLRNTVAGNSITAGLSFYSSVFLSAASGSTFTLAFQTQSNQLGWIKIRFVDGGRTEVQYLGAAYEDTPGTGIEAGIATAIPEPGSFGLLGLAALAIGCRRNRKSQTKSAVNKFCGK